MAIRTKDEIMQSIRARIGEDQSDEALALVEDISDTIDDLASSANVDGVNWKQRYEENDATWRQKYRDRFFADTPTEDVVDDVPSKPKTYEDLFKEE